MILANLRNVLKIIGYHKKNDKLYFQMDVHVFLFSDMLLLCKNLTKVKGDKGNSGSTGHHYGPATGSANPYGPGTDAKVKVIRQPYVIDRLVVVDISKDAHSGSQGRLIVVMYHCKTWQPILL